MAKKKGNKKANQEAPQPLNSEEQQNVAISGSNEFLDPNLINLIKQLNAREQQWLYGFASDFFQYKRIATQPTIPEEIKGDKIVEYVDPKLIFKQNANPDKHNHLPLRHGRPRKRDLVYYAIRQFYNNLTITDLRTIFPNYYEEYIKANKISKNRLKRNKYEKISLDIETIKRLFVFSNKDFINELENIIFKKYKEIYIQENPELGLPRSMARYKITKTIFFFAMRQFTNDIFLGIA